MTRALLLLTMELFDIRVLFTAFPRAVVEEYPVESI